MQVIEIRLEEILEDFFFCFAERRSRPELLRSIRLEGVRTPVTVLEAQNGYRILSGFSRVAMAREAGLQSVLAVVAEEPASPQNAFFRALVEHTASRALNLAEKARILEIMERLGVPPGRLDASFLEVLQLPAEEQVLEDVRAILTLHPAVLRYIAQYDVSLKQAKRFHGLPQGLQRRFADLGLKYAIRIVELSGLLELARDIEARGEPDAGELFDTWEGEAVRTAGKKEGSLSRNDVIRLLKEALQRTRYPYLTEKKDALDRLRRGLKLPDGLSVSWDPDLEREGIECRFWIRNRADVIRAAAFLANEKTQALLEAMCGEM